MDAKEYAEQALAVVGLFQGLNREDLQELADITHRVSHRAGEVIWRQGDLGTTFYVVLEGEVEARVVDPRGIERVDRTLGPGEYFGETSLLTGETHEATMVPRTDCELLCIRKADFDDLLRRRSGMVQRLRMRSEVRRKYEAPHFAWFEAGEVPALFRLRHPAHLAWRLKFGLAVFLGGVVLMLVGGAGEPSVALVYVGAILSALGALWCLWDYVDWRNDFFMVTNRRVVQVEKVVLLSEVRNQAGLEQIQDVHTTRRGPIHYALGVGDVSLETAGQTGQIGFTFVSDPEGVRETIFQQIDRMKALERATTREEIRRALERRLQGEPVPEPEEPLKPEAPPHERKLLSVRTLREMLEYLRPRMREERGGVITWRKHWYILLRKTGLQILVLGFLTVWGLTSAGSQATCMPVLFAWLGVLCLFWYHYEDWRNDIYQVAGDMIVDMKKRPLLLGTTRKTGELDNIQNVSARTEGVFQQVLNVGDVLIETAGRTQNFEFKGVHNPQEVANEIWRALARRRRRVEREERVGRQQELADWFEEYERLKGGRERVPPAGGPGG